MQDGCQMQHGSHAEQLPVAARKHALAVHGIARVCVAQEAKRGNGAEELVANGPAQGPLAAKEAGPVFVVGRAGRWEGDEERGDGHVGLGYGISCKRRSFG